MTNTFNFYCSEVFVHPGISIAALWSATQDKAGDMGIIIDSNL